MPRKKVIKVARSEPSAVTPVVAVETPVEKVEVATPVVEEVGVDTLVNLIVAYTNKTRIEAHHIVSGVVSKGQTSNKTKDVIEWCTYIKHIEQMQEMIQSVSDGHSLVTKVDGKWGYVTGDGRTA